MLFNEKKKNLSQCFFHVFTKTKFSCSIFSAEKSRVNNYNNNKIGIKLLSSSVLQMKKGKIWYVEEEKHRQRVKSFRYIRTLSYELHETASADFNLRFAKSIKYLKKFETINPKLIPRLVQTFNHIKRLQFTSCGSKEMCLLKRCKNITWLTNALETEKLLRNLQTLTQLKLFAVLSYPTSNNYSKELESLLNQKHYEILYFHVESWTEGSLKPLNFKNTPSLGISMNETKTKDFNLVSSLDTFRKIKSVTLTLDEHCSRENLRKFLKSAANIQRLSIHSSQSPFEELAPTEGGIIKSMSGLRDFDYYGRIFGPKFASLNCNMFAKDNLRTLRIVAVDKNLDSYFLGRFLRQIKQLVNLEDLDLHFYCLVYADQIVHDLPCSLPNIKTVNLRFGQYGESIKGDIELRLHLNAFLDWIVSLPNLEEVYLAHPSINYCYCSYLEDYKVSPKLREVQIIETEEIYDLSLLEVEYLEHDLATILKILSTESLEKFVFPIHLESFKQNMVDVVVQNLTRCVNLRELELTLWFNMLGEKTANKVISLFSSFYSLKRRDFIVQYCEAEQKENFGSKDLSSPGDMKFNLNFKKFEQNKPSFVKSYF